MKISNPDNAGNQRSHEIDGWPHAGRGGRWKNDLSEITIKADKYEIGSKKQGRQSGNKFTLFKEIHDYSGW